MARYILRATGAAGPVEFQERLTIDQALEKAKNLCDAHFSHITILNVLTGIEITDVEALLVSQSGDDSRRAPKSASPKAAGDRLWPTEEARRGMFNAFALTMRVVWPLSRSRSFHSCSVVFRCRLQLCCVNGSPVRSAIVLKKNDDRRFDLASILLREIDEATSTLDACLSDLEKVLERPSFDAGALTSVRLRLAGIRLTRGPLIMRVSDFLAGHVTKAEQASLDELRMSHQRILQMATAHTAKWTLDAISTDWIIYRRETRRLVDRWRAKANRDEQLIYPMIKKAIGS